MESSQRAATANSIVLVLKNYGSVPLDFLAQKVGHITPEILEYLRTLEEEGVIKRQDDTVALVK